MLFSSLYTGQNLNRKPQLESCTWEPIAEINDCSQPAGVLIKENQRFRNGHKVYLK
jgi:hypothetical protein